MNPALELQSLTVRDRSGTVLVREVSLEARLGQPLVIIGETGSGKSLVAQAILGLLPPGFSAAGTVRFGSQPSVPAGNAAALRLFWARQTMLLPQEPRAALDPTMRVRRQLARVGDGADPGLAGALAAVDLPIETAEAYAFTLSGGMAQRVLVATALTSGAPLIVADELTKGLDMARAAQILALLRSLLACGRALVAITHDLALARGLGGVIAVMREGELVETGPVAELFAAPRHPYTRALIAADPSTWRVCPRCQATDDLVLAGHRLGFAYPGRPALFRDLDLHLPRCCVLALCGPSGSGKTTLGNLLLGLQRPTGGEVSWAGIDPYRDQAATRRLRRRYQKLHQDPATAFIPHRQLGRQLGDLVEVAPELDLAAALPPLLDRLKLKAGLLDRYPGELSGGEAQRLALARVLLLEPSLVVADEPTSRLDLIRQKETIELLREFVDDRGMGLVLISHDRALVAATADKVVDLS